MAKYQRKPYIVDAIRWFKNGDFPGLTTGIKGKGYYLFTDNGYVEVDPGDWIVTCKDSNVDCYSDKVFRRIFELVKE